MINMEFVHKRLKELKQESTAKNYRAWNVRKQNWVKNYHAVELMLQPNDFIFHRDSGLKDKNKKIVFVGDIVFCSHQNKVGVVEHDNNTDVFSIRWNDQTQNEFELGKLNIDEMEVIANIIEHHDILTEYNLK